MAQQQSQPVAVIGGGSWATALVKIISENHIPVQWWMRKDEDVKHLRRYHHNPRYLSNASFDMTYVHPSTDLQQVLKGVRFVIIAVPAAFVEDSLKELGPEDFAGKVVVSAVKGMIPRFNWLLTDYFQERFGMAKDRLGVIAGPCHAEEVALEKQSYLTIGCLNMAIAEEFCRVLENRYVVATPLHDIDGVEYCAVMKNIIAIACGIARGVGYGDNFQAVLVSNAMQEIDRFLHAVMPVLRDLHGSAYLGDLLVTAYSQFSRNRTFGTFVGRGYSVKAAQLEMNMIAEGYYAVKSIHELNKKLKVDMPITMAVYHMLYEKVAPTIEMRILKEKFR